MSNINTRFRPVEYMLELDIANIDTDADYYITYPYTESAFLVSAAITNDAAITTADATVALAINGTTVVGGSITIANSSGAGSTRSVTIAKSPTSRIKKGDVLKVTLGGSSGGSSRGHFIAVLSP